MKANITKLLFVTLAATCFVLPAQAQEARPESPQKRFNRLVIERNNFYRDREDLKRQAAQREANGEPALVLKANISYVQEKIDWREEQLERLSVELGKPIPTPSVFQTPESEKAQLQNTINNVTSVGNEAVVEIHRNNCKKILKSLNFGQFLNMQ